MARTANGTGKQPGSVVKTTRKANLTWLLSGFGRKLLLLTEKYGWVKEKLLNMKVPVPYGPGVDAVKVVPILFPKVWVVRAVAHPI